MARRNRAYNSFEMAQAQFDRVAELLELDAGTRELLRDPLREYAFSIPVRMDDGSSKVFKGFRGAAQRRKRAFQGWASGSTLRRPWTWSVPWPCG